MADLTAAHPGRHTPTPTPHLTPAPVHHGAHPVIELAQWLFTTTGGRVLLVAVVLLLACVFNTRVRRVLAPFWRLATGGLVFVEPGPWDSTFDRPAPDRPQARPNFRGERYPRTRWAKIPGYQRMAARWTGAGYLYVLWQYPVAVMTLTAAGVAGVTGRKVAHVLQDHAHARIASPFTTGVATVLGQQADDPATFIGFPRLRPTLVPIALDERVTRTARHVPRVGPTLEHMLGRLAVPALRIPLHDDEAQVMVHLDAQMVDLTKVQAIKHLGQARLPEGPWDATHHESQLVITFTHPKRPPAVVMYDADANREYTIDDVPIGQRAGGQWVTLPLKTQTPHGIMSATTGWCKTTTANVFVAHTAGNGGRVFINDPKRTGFLHLQGVPSVVIRTTADGWAETNRIFLEEMERRYELIERFPLIKEDPELYFQPWFMLNDERGSYVADLKERAKSQGEKGLPAPLRQEKKILWQGRAAAMYVCDMAQQANLSVFVDSDGRDQRMWRIASGPQTPSSWRMLFSGAAKRTAGMKKGRAVLGIGVDSVEEITLARVSDTDARDFAEKGSAIADRENQARNKRLNDLIENEDDEAADDAPAHTADDDHPAGSTPDAPGQQDRTGAPGNGPNDGTNVLQFDMRKDEESAAPENADTSSDDDEEELIVGNAAGARFLDMKESNFISSRKRRPIPGEKRRVENGLDQPAWRPLDLREWRSQAPRAGAS
jgi:hypothetical protein